MRQQPPRPDSPLYTEFEPDKRSAFNGYHRSSFTALPNATRPSKHHPTFPAMPSSNSHNFRDVGAYQHEAYGLSSPTQTHLQPSLVDMTNYGAPFGLAEPYANYNKLTHSSQAHSIPHTVNPHAVSQTPYGPHLATNPVSMGVNTGHGSGSGNMNSANNMQEDISTIFVVGFPDDMQEREFQNMFTFSSGFEAATLKIPNKEYTAYGVSGSAGAAPPGLSAVINDPYNLVTMNQGGVVVDGGRDGTMSSWPTAPIDDSYYPPGPTPNPSSTNAVPGTGPAPRKQIIGFAKFRTREEALEARDVLQGRRVDIEKGAVLKAEMAKKNLHTKRGVTANGGSNTNTGPMNGNIITPLSSANHLGPALAPLAPNAGMGLSANAPLSHHYDLYPTSSASLAELGPGNMSIRDRELGTLGAMGFSNAVSSNHTSSSGTTAAPGPSLSKLWEDDRERKVFDAMGLGLSSGDESSRPVSAKEGGRRRVETKKNECPRDDNQPLRLRSGSAFDAFHSVPASAALSQNTLVSQPHQRSRPIALSSLPTIDNSVSGPWDHFSKSSAGSHVPNSASSKASHSSNDHSRSSRSSSVAADSIHSKHSARDTSPQLPSPSSGSGNSASGVPAPAAISSTSSTSSTRHAPAPLHHFAQNPISNPNLSHLSSLPSSLSGITSNVDQNPPINTLYVGNLPISPPPMGYPPDILEESLRELFRTRPGYKRLSFKQKHTGPMCFVEFEDVNAATKTINELYGNTLNGLVKGGGIRLSYSKNPLGIRTPTSANGTGAGFQQPHFQPQVQNGRDGDRERGERYAFGGTQALSPTPHHQSVNHRAAHTHDVMISPPPPRFATGAHSNIPFGNFSSSSFGGVPTGSGSNVMFGSNNYQGGGSGGGYESNTTFSPFDSGHMDHPQLAQMTSLPMQHQGPNPNQNQNF
ncbi:hypothetical protein EV360DRAFT_55719 [Lentinula raphanica]|nr:hypothetical protein EV360DRAFT_55719 [Lentinula raphanica]